MRIHKTKNTHRRNLWVILSLLLVGQPCAQPTRHANLLTSAEGLSQTTNHFVFQDSRGYTWVSSITGVELFDGHSVRSLAAAPGQSCALIEGNVQSPFFEDNRGRVWFSTGQYLHQYDYFNDCFTHQQPGDPALPDYGVRVIGMEQGRWLWGMANNELFVLDTEAPAGDLFWPGQRVTSMRFAVDTLPDGRFARIVGCLWAYGQGLEVFTLDGERCVQRATWELEDIQGQPVTFTNGMADTQRCFWLASNRGLVRYDGTRATLFVPPTGSQGLMAAPLWLDANTLLLGTVSGDLWHFDIRSKAFVRWPLPTAADGKSISALYLDDAQNLWIAVEGLGLLYGPSRNRNAFRTIPFPPAVGTVYGMALHPKRRLPVVTFARQGIWQLTEGRFLPWSNVTTGIFIAADTTAAYFGNGSGLFRLAAAQSTPELVFSDNGSVYDLWLHPPTIMVAQSDKLLQYALDGSHPTDTLHDLGFAHCFLTNPHQQEVLIGNEADLYIYQWDATQNRVGQRLHQFHLPLTANSGVYDSLRQCYWIGGQQELLRIDVHTRKVRKLSELTGIKKAQWVSAIAQDDDGLIWFSTHNGLYRYHPESAQQPLLHFTQKDGLGGNEYQDRMVVKTPDGRLWFGNQMGVDVVDPAAIESGDAPPRLAFRDVLVMGKPHPQRADIFQHGRITLPYYNNTLTFKIAALDYADPARNVCWIHLHGYDSDTTHIGTQREITYANLPPGQYTFAFTAANAAGIKNPSYKTLQIDIRPPYWKTGWFRALAVGLLATIAYWVARAYLHNRLREQRHTLEKQQLLLENELRLQTERNRIADELHDDLGGKLSTILFAGSRMMRMQNLQEAQTLMQKVNGISVELIDAMRSIIWAMDTQNDRLSSLLAAMRNYAAKFGEDNELDLHIHIPILDAAADRSVHGLFRHSVLLAMKEILHNSLKHAHATSVVLTVEVQTEYLRVSLQDNGQGFDVEAAWHKGKGLQSLQKRMAKVDGHIRWDSHPDTGTFVAYQAPFQQLETAHKP